jgi:hypothetical protein
MVQLKIIYKQVKGEMGMKCLVNIEGNQIILSVENIETEKLKNTVCAAFFKESNGKYVKTFSKDFPEADLIEKNFPRMAETMFTGKGAEWRKALMSFAEVCKQKSIQWYLSGSCCEAVRGMKITPHDIDVHIFTEQFYDVRDAFPEYIMEPFQDLGNSWAVRYFGRLCIEGIQIDVAADEKANLNNHLYDSIYWNGIQIFLEPLN